MPNTWGSKTDLNAARADDWLHKASQDTESFLRGLGWSGSQPKDEAPALDIRLPTADEYHASAPWRDLDPPKTESATPSSRTSTTPAQLGVAAARSTAASGAPSATASAAPRGDPSGGVEQWNDLIQEAAKTYGVDPSYIKGLMHIESSGNPNAVSAAGAKSLMQVMPFHFKDGEDGMDPRTNIMRGTQIFADNLRRYGGDPDKAAAAYFGAIDANGNITGASDGNTDGYGYVRQFRDATARYQGAPTVAPSTPGAAGPPSPSPAAATSSPPSFVAGSPQGAGPIRVRDPWGNEWQTTQAALNARPGGYADLTIVSAPTMQKTSDTMPADEPALSPGDQKRERLAAASGQAVEMPQHDPPFDWLPAREVVNPPAALDTQRTIRNVDFETGAVAGDGTPDSSAADQVQYRQPLKATGGPDTTTGDDTGLGAAQYGAGGDDQGAMRQDVTPDVTVGDTSSPSLDPGGAGFAAQDAYSQPEPSQRYDPFGGSPDPTADATRSVQPDAAPTSPSSPMLPVLDENGQQIAWRAAPAPAQRQVQQRLSDGTGQVSSTIGEPDYVAAPPNRLEQAEQGYLTNVAAGGAPAMGSRIRAINDQAARDQGRTDARAMFDAADDPAWRAAHPELAAEYDDLQNQYGLTVVGQAGDVPNMGRAPQTVEALEQRLVQARNIVDRLIGSGDPQRLAQAQENRAAIESALADARNARRSLEPRIRSDVGARESTVPPSAETVENRMDAVRPTGQGRMAPGDLSGPVSIPTDVGGRMNAGFGALPDEPRRVAPAQTRPEPAMSPAAQDLMTTYQEVTPARTQAASQRAVQLVSDDIARKVPTNGEMPPADLVPQIHEAIVQGLADSKVVATGLRKDGLAAFLNGEGITSKTATEDWDEITRITQGQVNVGGGRLKTVNGKAQKVPYSTEDAAGFAHRESEQMRAATGGTRFPDPARGGRIDAEAPAVNYAYVTEGQPLIGPNSPDLWLVWDHQTPRITSAHHPYALLSPNQDIHQSMPPGLKAALWHDSVRGGVLERGPDGAPIVRGWEQSGVKTPGGRTIADTNWLVGPGGEDAMRASGLLMSMPQDVQRAIARGEMRDPDEIAAILMRGGGVRNKEYAGFGAAQSSNRSESLILDPHPGNVQAIYVAGPPSVLTRRVPNVPNAQGKTGMSALDTARAVRQKILDETGRDVPILYTDTSARGGSKLITDAQVLEGQSLGLAPGRSGIVDRYTRAGYEDIGASAGTLPPAASPDRLATVNRALGQGVMSAVSGGTSAAAADQLGDPNDPNRQAKAFVAGAALPLLATRGAGALARRVGAEGAAEGGALSAFGNLPGVQQSIAASQRRAARMAATNQKPLGPLQWTGKLAESIGYSSMIGIRTATVNLLGNAMEPMWALPKEAVRGGTRAITERNASALREPGEMFYGAANGLWNAGGELVDALASRGRYASADQPTLSQQTINPIAHAIATVPEIGGRIFSGLPDALFGSIARGAGEAREAAQIATNDGLKGAAWKQRVQQVLADRDAVMAGTLKADPSLDAAIATHVASQSGQQPALIPTAQNVLDEIALRERLAEAQQTIRAGGQYAKEQTFQNELGTAGKAVEKVARLGNAPVLGKLVAPFTKTPINMTRTMMERTPVVGNVLGLTQKTRPAFDKNYDVLAGTALIAGLVAGPAAAGRITGSGPDDDGQKRLMRENGWLPQSTLVRGPDGQDYYVQNNKFGIYGKLLNVIGEVHDAMVYGKKDASIQDQIESTGKRFGMMFQNEAQLQGISDLLQAITDPGKHAIGYVGDLATRLTPYAATARDISTSQDTQERETDRGKNVPATTQIVQRWEQGTGQRSVLPVDEGLRGPRENTSPGIWAFFPKASKAKNDPVVQTFLNANVDLPRERQSVTVDNKIPQAQRPAGQPSSYQIPLTPEKTRIWENARNRELVKLTESAFKNPLWDEMAPGAQQQLLQKYVEAAAKTADTSILTRPDMQAITSQAIRDQQTKSSEQYRTGTR